MIRKLFVNLIIVMVAYLSFSCTDEKDIHYSRSATLPNETLYELISKDADLSIFAQLVKIAEYDTLLSSTQTFTVWAPVNAAFSDINLTTISKDEARLIVNNHIARFNNSTTTLSSKSIRMRNNKIYSFTNDGTVFGTSKIVKHDILAKNGLLHTLEAPIPYHYNLYEYIQSIPDMSKLATFISLFDEEKFDEELSIPIDINDNGQTIYDTVTTKYNRLFDDKIYGLGQIEMEDSVYTMLMPTNTAWDNAYARISPYFNVYNEDPNYADSIKNVQTSLAILEDLIYRGKINTSADSVTSTSPSVIHNPTALFTGSTKTEGSNGLIYTTDNLNYDNTDTWNKYIYVESDESAGRTIGTNTAVYTRTVTDNSLISISNYRYIDVQPTTPSAQPAVTYEIPQVLSGTYDIYVEFIPASIDGNPSDSTKLLFQLSYMNASGKNIDVLVNSADFKTSGTKKVKMKVFNNFTFPVSNYYDRLWWMDYEAGKHTNEDYVVTTKLLIKTNVTNSDFNKNIYTRKFRIDRIIFESVRN